MGSLFRNQKVENFPSGLKKQRQNLPICGEAHNTRGSWATTDYLIYATESVNMLHMGLHYRHHGMISVCFPSEPDIRGQGEVKKSRNRAFQASSKWPHGGINIATAKCHLPNFMSRPATKWLCDRSQGHMIYLGF